MKRVRQAGAIVFRPRGSSFEILLVTAKRDPSAWIFPKGHIEHGETSDEAALREACEEAGVRGVLVGRAGQPLAFTSKAEKVSVQYFLIEATGEVASEEGRTIRWLAPDEACRLVTHEKAKALLEEVLPMIADRFAAQG